MKRREALTKLAISTGTLVILPSVFVSCEKTDTDPDPDNNNDLTIDLSKSENDALNSDGGSLISGSIIIINTGSGIFVALSNVCTHNGCVVTYNAANNNLPCPCHGSIFASNGNVINGPATTSLKKYAVSKSGDILTIS